MYCCTLVDPTMVKICPKSRIQYCERSELCLHFESTKGPKMSNAILWVIFKHYAIQTVFFNCKRIRNWAKTMIFDFCFHSFNIEIQAEDEETQRKWCISLPYFHLYLSHQLFRHWISLLLLKVVALIPELSEKVKPELSFVRTQKLINFRSSGIISMRSRTLRKFLV